MTPTPPTNSTLTMIAPGLWRWTARHPEWHPGEFGKEVASFAVHAEGATLLVDPLLPQDEPEVALDALDGIINAPAAILITIPYHTRSAEQLATRYGATIHGHPATAKRLNDDRAFYPLEPGQDLPGGAQAFAIGRPRRYEQPLWLPSHRALVFGDALVGVDNGLRTWAQAPVDEHVRDFYRQRFNPTLQPLVDLNPERVLVGHGKSIVSKGAEALRAALSADPWTSRADQQAGS